MFTVGEARRIVDTVKDEPGSGIMAWSKLKDRFWGRDQRGLIKMSGNIMSYPRPKELKKTYMAKMDIIDMVREWERVANDIFNLGMNNCSSTMPP